MRRTGVLLRWVLTANILAFVAALALSAPATGAAGAVQGVRDFVAWCVIG